MSKIKAIALNTYREAIRNKILYTSILFLFIILGISSILGSFTMGETRRFVIDFGLSGMELFGVIIAIVIGTSMLYNEIQRRTIYTVLSRPIRRWEFILGKFLGLGMAILVLETIMFVIVSIFLVIVKGSPNLLFLAGGLYILLTILMTISLSIFFSTFSSPLLSGFFTAIFYFVGESLEEIRVLFTMKLINSQFAKGVINFVYYLLPNFGNLNIKNAVVHNVPLPEGYILNSIAYALGYILFLLTLSTLLFEKKEFY